MSRIADLGTPSVATTASVGSTPAMTAAENLDGVDEARPGNYVFFDRTQLALGCCALEDCAVTVLTSVVSCPPGADHAVVDAGALALSKDAGRPSGVTWGDVFVAGTPPHLDADLSLVSLSQEHGVLSRPVSVGTKVRILPNHSCLAVACFDHFVCVRGDQVIDRWRIWRGRG